MTQLPGILHLSSPHTYSQRNHVKARYGFQTVRCSLFESDGSTNECLVSTSLRTRYIRNGGTGVPPDHYVLVKLGEYSERDRMYIGTLIHDFGSVNAGIQVSQAFALYASGLRTTWPQATKMPPIWKQCLIPPPKQQPQCIPTIAPIYNFSLDPPGCRDVDDALGVWWSSDGHHARAILVHIADPVGTLVHDLGVSPGDIAKWIHPSQYSTIYDAKGRVVCPFLHPQISEDGASLLQGQIRRVWTFVFMLDDGHNGHNGHNVFLVNSHIQNDWQGTYCEPGAMPVEVRRAYSAVVEATPSAEARADAHALVAYWMIRANEFAAHVLAGYADTGAVFRRQPVALQHAEYCETPDSHASLGLSAYTHFTSPMRRWCDFANHCVFHGVPVPTTCVDNLNCWTEAHRQWQSMDAILQLVEYYGTTDETPAPAPAPAQLKCLRRTEKAVQWLDTKTGLAFWHPCTAPHSVPDMDIANARLLVRPREAWIPKKLAVIICSATTTPEK